VFLDSDWGRSLSSSDKVILVKLVRMAWRKLGLRDIPRL
jgi:hypothetical protein